MPFYHHNDAGCSLKRDTTSHRISAKGSSGRTERMIAATVATVATVWACLGRPCRRLILAATVTIALPSMQVFAGDKLPSAAQLFDAHVAATGGRRAYKNIKNRVIKAKIKTEDDELSISVTIYAAAPNKISYISQMENVGTFYEGTDGVNAWSMGPLGPKLKLGDEKRQAMQNAVFNPELHWIDHYENAKVVGIEEVAGKPAYKLVATPRGASEPETLHFDVESHLLVKKTTTRKTDSGALTAETWYEDYRPVDGLLIPFTRRTFQMDRVFVIAYESVQQNVDIPESRFAPPGPVKVLLSGQAAPAKNRNKTQDKK